MVGMSVENTFERQVAASEARSVWLRIVGVARPTKPDSK
jgi:hypothetical protein